jgi:hypothetical protein
VELNIHRTECRDIPDFLVIDDSGTHRIKLLPICKRRRSPRYTSLQIATNHPQRRTAFSATI